MTLRLGTSLRHLRDGFFGWFEGPCDPYPFAVFRLSFYSGILLHFLPSVLAFDHNYKAAIARVTSYHSGIHHSWDAVPNPVASVFPWLVMAICTAGLLGVMPRLSAALSGLGLYVLVSVNDINTQTLALSPMFAILWIWAVFGGGNKVLSLRAVVQGNSRVGSLTTQRVIAAHVLIGFFFAGIEKLLAGWPLRNEMAILFVYPEHLVTRSWAAELPPEWAIVFGSLLGISTLAVELVGPFALLLRQTRLPALIVFELFFVGIVLVLAVPPLFAFIYVPAAWLTRPAKPREAEASTLVGRRVTAA